MTDTKTYERIPERIGKLKLQHGLGNPDAGTACIMSRTAWELGLEFGDTPPCTHPIIARVVISLNDTMPVADLNQAYDLLSDPIVGTETFTDFEATWCRAAVDANRDIFAIRRLVARIVTVKSGAVLRSADLSGADLRSADLSGAVLRSADLRSAVLRSADLSGADLRSADLSGADLSGADLSGADLSGAVLRSAVLRYAPRGNKYTQLPVGYVVNDAGLIVRTS